jgi:hypothetical protein
MVTLKQLEKAIRSSWGRNTCHFKFLWDDKSQSESAGHCRVVAILVQDYFGGDIMHTHVRGMPKWDHFYNLVKGKKVDLTYDQFPKNTKFVRPNLVSRKEALKSKRTQNLSTISKAWDGKEIELKKH